MSEKESAPPWMESKDPDDEWDLVAHCMKNTATLSGTDRIPREAFKDESAYWLLYDLRMFIVSGGQSTKEWQAFLKSDRSKSGSWAELKLKQKCAGRPSKGFAPGPAIKRISERNKQAATESKLVVRSMNDIKMEPVEWLIPGVFIIGKLNILAAPGGEGKSTFMRRVIADGSKGVPTLGMDYKTSGPFDTLICSLEEDPADTVKPSLFANNADMNRIHIIEGIEEAKKPGVIQAFTAAHSAALIGYMKEKPEIKLLLLDPLTGVMGKTKQNDGAEVRAALQPLVDFARESGVCVVGITHTTKAQDVGRPADKIMGSVTFVNLARQVCMIARDESDADLRLLVCGVKTNYSGQSVHAFRIAELDADTVQGIRESDELDHLSHVDQQKLIAGLRTCKWETAPAEVNIDAILSQKPKKNSATEKARCMDFLKSFLADFAFPHREIEKAALKEGFSVSTFKDAKAALKADEIIWPKPEGQGEDRVWWWGPGRNTREWIKRPEPTLDDSSETPLVPNNPQFPKFSELDPDRGPTLETLETAGSLETLSSLETL